MLLQVPAIPSDEILLRTLLEPTWVRNGKPHATAFLLRESDGNQLSVLFNKAEAARRFQRYIFGFLDVSVGRVRDLRRWNLDILQDPADPDHAYITGLPSEFGIYSLMTDRKKYIFEMRRQMLLAADDIADHAASINEYSPAGFDPVELLSR